MPGTRGLRVAAAQPGQPLRTSITSRGGPDSVATSNGARDCMPIAQVSIASKSPVRASSTTVDVSGAIRTGPA